MNTILKYVLRLVLTGLFLLLIMVLNWQIQEHYNLPLNGTLMSLILLSTGALVLITQISKIFFFIAASGSHPTALVLRFHQDGVLATVQYYLKMHISERGRALLHYGVWGSVVVVFVLILFYLNIFKGKEEFFLTVPRLAQNYENTFPQDVPVVRFALFTEDNNLREYLENALKISKDLRSAGAKTVIITLPNGIPAVPKMMDRMYILLRQIQSLGYVVAESTPGDRPNKHRTYQADTTRTVFSSDPIDTDPENYLNNNIIHWIPLVEWPLGKRKYHEIDASIRVAKKYFDIPDSVREERIGDEVVISWLRIPVTPEGRAYSDNYGFRIPFAQVTANRNVFRGPEDHSDEDSVQYWEDVYSPTAMYKSPDDVIPNLDRFKNTFTNKVVVVDWINASEQRYNPVNGTYLSSVIAGVLQQRFYTRNLFVWSALLIVSVCMMGVSVVRLRMHWSFVISIVLIAAVTATSIWSFFSYRNIVEVLYLYV
ncbi:MAG: hypothetical protein WCW40_02130, partial [Bacteroidota bacterium]